MMTQRFIIIAMAVIFNSSQVMAFNLFGLNKNQPNPFDHRKQKQHPSWNSEDKNDRVEKNIATQDADRIAAVQMPEEQDAPIVDEPTHSEEDLQKLLNAESQSLTEIEALLNSGRYGEAMARSKSALDRIKFITGIDPKVNMTRPIKVKNVLNSNYELSYQFSMFQFRQQAALMLAVSEYLSGFYLDLLNLSKRTYVKWVHAQYMRVKQEGQLYDRDIEKFRRDLAKIHHSPIYIQDEAYANFGPLIISDKDVTDEDHQYYFDREILDTGTKIPELKLDESAFDDLVSNLWNERRTRHIQSLRVSPPAPVQTHIGTIENFNKCLSFYQNYDSNARACMVHAKDFDFFDARMSACVASQNNYDSNVNYCIEKIKAGDFNFR